MKIGMIASSYPRYAGDGAGSFVASLARALVAAGNDIHVLAPYDPDVEPMDTGGVDVRRFHYAPRKRWHIAGHGRALEADRRMRRWVPALMPGFAASCLAQALRLQARHRLDLWHGHWAVPGGALAAIAARATRRPLLVSLHGSDVYVIEQSRLYARAARYGFAVAGAVTACSEDLRNRALKRGLSPSKSLVMPYGVDVDRYARGDGAAMRRRLGIPAAAPVVGALGRLVHKKGFMHLLAAMPRLVAAVPDVYCVIGGEGDLRPALMRQVRSLGLSGRVLLPGHVGWEDTADYYAMCDLVVVPSIVDTRGNVDGLPNVLLEAMASGRPIVASRVAGIPAVVEDQVNGLLVSPGDEEELATAMARLLAREDDRRRLGAAARAHMVKGYTWEVVAERTAALYRRVLTAFAIPRA